MGEHDDDAGLVWASPSGAVAESCGRAVENVLGSGTGCDVGRETGTNLQFDTNGVRTRPHANCR